MGRILLLDLKENFKKSFLVLALVFAFGYTKWIREKNTLEYRRCLGLFEYYARFIRKEERSAYWMMLRETGVWRRL